MNGDFLYAEKPVFPRAMGIWTAVVPLGVLALIWVPHWGVGQKIVATFFVSIIFLMAGGATVVPFIRHREISLTPDGLLLKLGPYEDNISTYDIISVELVDKANPEGLWGEEVWGALDTWI